jgi:hemerythrin-like domain-containing protein
MTKEEVERIMKVAFVLQYINECIDDVEGDYPWKQQIKKSGNVFRQNVDRFLNGILKSVDQEELENYNAVTKEFRQRINEAYNEITVTQ